MVTLCVFSFLFTELQKYGRSTHMAIAMSNLKPRGHWNDYEIIQFMAWGTWSRNLHQIKSIKSSKCYTLRAGELISGYWKFYQIGISQNYPPLSPPKKFPKSLN